MTSLAIGIVIGAVLGAGIALFVAAWCMAAADADRRSESLYQKTLYSARRSDGSDRGCEQGCDCSPVGASVAERNQRTLTLTR